MVLLFDFGGVLVDLDRAAVTQAFARLGIDIAPHLGTYKQGGMLSALERNDVTVSAFCEGLRGLSSLERKPSDTDLIEAWDAYTTHVPAESLEMLLKIKKNYPVSLLSNTNVIHWAKARYEFFRYDGRQVEDFFDQIFLSYAMGVEKPAPEIFRRVVEMLRVPASEVLFLDDSEANCEAARQCGLRARVAPADSGWLPFFDSEGRYLEETE